MKRLVNVNKNQRMLSVLLLALLFVRCSKIDVPAPEDKKVFGSWTFEATYGGFSGGGSNADNDKRLKDTWIRLSDTGIWTNYEGKKKINQGLFKIKKGNSILGTDHTMIITKGGYQYSFQVVGDTALSLSEEAYDGLTYVYKKRW